MPNTVAQDVVVDRVSLPVQGGSVRPIDVLSVGPCPGRAQVSRTLRRLEERLPAWPSPTLRPCHRIAPDAEIQLGRKLCKLSKPTGDLDPLVESLIRRRPRVAIF